MYVALAHDWQTNKVKNWLLAILRFSLTLEPQDEAAVMAMDEIDRLGFVGKTPGFSFFLRTSAEVCNAIKDVNYPGRTGILRSHFAKIDEHHRRQTLFAACRLGAGRPVEVDRAA
jgi:hypothetical protein